MANSDFRLITIEERTPAPPSTSTIIQFLSLFLMVLAFFILLVSISSYEKVRFTAVKDSLNSAFKPILPATTNPTLFTSQSGRILAAEEFQGHIEGLFSTALGVEQTEIVQPGRLMRVVMAADSLFEPGTTRLREANLPLLDRLITSLSGHPPGFHFDMEFVIGSDDKVTGNSPVTQTFQMERTGAFVRSMLARGVPPDTISIGIRQGEPNLVTMWFYIRSPQEVDAYYDRLRNPEGPPPEIEIPGSGQDGGGNGG